MKDKISKKTDTKQIISQKSIPTKNQQDIFDESPIIIPDDNLLIVNSWGRAVPQPKPTIIFKKEVYGKAGAWTLIKAKTGAGKTSFIEVIASAYLGQLEIMGITCQMYDGKTKIMIVDTEQTESESQDSYDRIWKRIGCKKDKDNPPDNVNKLIHIGLKRFANDTNRMFNIIEQTIKENNNSIGLIILDVGSDFCPEVNNEGDVNKLIKWLCKFNEKVTIVITWHINEGVDGQKSGGDTARGHGKSLERKCSYTLQLSMDDETGIGTITAKKNRKGEKPKLNYIYDKELQYFIVDR